MTRAALSLGPLLGACALALVACSSPTGAAAPTPTTSTSVVEEVPSSGGPAPSSASTTVEPTPSATPTWRRAREVRQLWESYPWGANDGLACPAPAYSSGVDKDPAAPGVVVIVGDSLIRDAREAIAASLGEAGFDVVFVCWGGKNLQWGLEQVTAMRSLDLMPACLVVNLGTNDLKGTTAQGLADAVPLATVSERLTQLLADVSDVPDVFVVDLAADLALAPGTMTEVGDAPRVWEAAVAETGVGAAIPWAQAVSQGGLIGSDGIHDSSDGQWTRARLIAEYVARDCTA